MTLESKFIAILIFILISNLCQFECQPATGSAPKPQQHRQIGQHHAVSTNSSSSSVGRIAAILAAKPRPVVEHLQQQKDLLRNKKAEANITSPAARLHSEESSVKQKTVSIEPTSGSKNVKPKSQVGKRQVDFADQNRLSRRNEDAWFLDQAPLPLQPYRFNYNVKDKNGLTEQYRQETGDGKFLTGSYGYVLPDGIFRHVDYVADDRGFRAFIRTSEPGTANQNPADVVINSSPVPGVSYATNPTSSLSSSSGLQLFGLQPKQQPSNWSDNSWNYSSLGIGNQFGPLGERFKSQVDGTLARRAPGSIVGTPLRNFSSLAYPLTSFGASLDLSTPLPPPASSWAPYQQQGLTNTGENFQSLARFGDLARLQPIRGINSTSFNSGLGGEQFQTHLTESSKLERERDQRLLSKTRDQISSGLASGQQQASDNNQERNSNLFSAQLPPFYHQRPGLLLPSRVGPDVLLYDRPFGIQQADGSGNAQKLSYNYNHILGAGDSAALQADERVRNLAHLDRLRALSRLYSRSDLAAPNSLGGSLLDYTPLRPVLNNVSNTIGQLEEANLLGNSITKTSSSSHSERHHEQKVTSQLVDDLNRVTITREQKNGFSLGSGHDSRQSSGSEQGAVQPSVQPPSQPLSTPQPPPQPQFNQQRWTPATKGQTLARLLAPYAGEHQFGTKNGVKSGQVQETSQHLADDANIQQQQQLSSTTASLPISPPDEPRAPTEPNQPDRDREQASSARPPDEIEPGQRMTGKVSAPQVVRSVRMPEDYRTSMLMNDLRSMQNAFGLPQPPRLQRSSSPSSGDGGDQQRFGGGPTNLAEQLVLARMARVESLLRDGAAASPAASSSSAHQQASVQQAVAVPASKPPAVVHQQEGDKFNRSNVLAALGRLNSSDNELDDDQPRRPASSAKPSVRPASNSEPAHRGRQQSNETLTLFEAQRLSNNRAKLRADKVSELEKFQQRLKNQQLLLEQIKSNENKLAQKQFKAGPLQSKPNEANSHVKYDEPQEGEPVRSGALEAERELGASNGRSLRHSGESEIAANGPKRHTTEAGAASLELTANKAHNESGYARQLKEWPSVSAGVERQRLSGTSNRSNETDASNSIDQLVKAHKMELPKLEDKGQKQTDSGNGTARSGPNTINLDFINSVTALSMDQLNPFAISSVNPAIQRASGAANSDRLSPHRLALPLASGGSGQDPASNSGSNLLATAPARYHSSNDLLTALDHHERQDAGQRMRNLLSFNSLNTPPANHRQPGDNSFNLASAPYFTQTPPESTASVARPFDGLLGAKFIVSPAGSSLATAANSQHKSIVPTPRPTRELNMRRAGGRSQTIGAIHRDGFEIRDRAVQADNHRFYEVVSGQLRQPDEMSSSFQAFRDAQLSIPAQSPRR